MKSKILHPTIYKDENIELFLEEYSKDGWGLFIHCYVYNCNSEIFKGFHVLWDSVLDVLLLQGYDKIGACIRTDDIKLIMFATSFGFGPTGTFISDNEGTEREIYTCLT